MAQPAESSDASSVQRRLHARGLPHLRARKYGSTIIVESGPKGDPFKHFRLHRDTVHLWLLDIAGHNQRWERTPFRAPLQELVDIVIDTFPWTLTDVTGNSERTSDRKH
jgi:hypothetical protein